jgi:Xaa-Pro aminopeptidase
MAFGSLFSNETPVASLGTTMAVDWESRVDFPRLRAQRMQKVQDALASSDCGAFVLFDMNNIRYSTSTHIGIWARDKLFRCVLVMRGQPPILWDIGSAAKQHRLHAPWLPQDSWRAGISSWRGSIPEEVGIERGNAKRIADLLREHGLANEPVGVDVVEIPVLRALEAQGLTIVNGQAPMQRVRGIKTIDEIALLDTAAAMVDGAYERVYRALRPGVRESEIVALVNETLYSYGSEEVEAVNSISGHRCSPHPHVFSDRIIRPMDTAYFDIIHSFNGYHTCYYRTMNVGGSTAKQRDAYKRARDIIDRAIAAVKAGNTTADIAREFPAATEFGFASEEEAFGLQYGHGLGLSNWEQPLTSRYHSFEHPVTIELGMVFALETYWPTNDGTSASRIEEEVVVTPEGAQVITKFPAQDLLVAGTRYYTGIEIAALAPHANGVSATNGVIA